MKKKETQSSCCEDFGLGILTAVLGGLLIWGGYNGIVALHTWYKLPNKGDMVVITRSGSLNGCLGQVRDVYEYTDPTSFRLMISSNTCQAERHRYDDEYYTVDDVIVLKRK